MEKLLYHLIDYLIFLFLIVILAVKVFFMGELLQEKRILNGEVSCSRYLTYIRMYESQSLVSYFYIFPFLLLHTIRRRYIDSQYFRDTCYNSNVIVLV